MAALDTFLTGVFFFELLLIATHFTLQENAMLLCAIAGAAGMVRVTKSTSRTVGRWFSRSYLKRDPFGDPLRSRKVMSKFCDQAWQLVAHTSMSALELYVLGSDPWFDDPTHVWLPHPKYQIQKPSLFLVYFAQLSIWIFTCFSHRFLEERRKDYYVMYLHHVTTIALVAGSYYMRYVRIGLMVLIVHDVSDITIDLLKMVNLLRLEGRPGLFLTEIVFATNIILWIYMRLFVFAKQVIWSTLYHSHRLIAERVDLAGLFWMDPMPPEAPDYIIFNILLCVLYVLHVWWTYLLLRIFFKILLKSPHQAGREEYEGESDDEQPLHKPSQDDGRQG